MTLRSKITKFSVAILSTVTLGSTILTTAANADEIYTVKSGDTLSGIEYSLNKDTNYSKLAKANKISNVNLIYVGQKLLIKSDGEIKAATKSEVKSTPTVKNISSTTSSSSAATSSTSSNTSSSASTTTSSTSSSEAAAKAWIANKESGGSYTATNGQYIGKYQLSSSYLSGDYSAANQEKVANSYVSSRYGSWTAAKAFWVANGWY
ncbi:LysM peptidoglycan-binding domain-containing protein [Pediococcus parvulus]|uniref:aggregation-promoting factor n=1 Tax=Pediococcus parvulus TaxID=54062 RepID=UPI0007089BEB|nr:LysM domain-containing protein [Pediococcus parvulus]MCT3027562.1 LysM domain-containing protein [Pediococcus parvulus]GEL90054.1 peptidase M23 [Pediococcus parvulus]GHC13211.1 peptidase M23 [Pediococcus parvulus]